MGPIIILTVTAFVVMILELLGKSGDKRWLGIISIAGVVAALVPAIQKFNAEPNHVMYTVILDAFGSVFTILLLITALLILLFSLDYSRRVKVASEHSYLILFALVGAIAMVTAIDLVTLYVGLELLSVASYVLAALRTKSARSVEAGIKYMLMGSIGSAVLLYGMSFLYGMAGTTNLIGLSQQSMFLFEQYPALTVIAFLFVLGGMGFKLSLVPFHMWTPDTYSGAPSPVSAFLSTLAKSAAFGMLLRLLVSIFYGQASNVFVWVGVLAAITMVVGNLIALPQRNMKRLLAFSSVAQAGYILVPFTLFGATQLIDTVSLFDSIAFYLFAYTFMTVGAFAVVHVVSNARGSADSDALIGLYRRSPWLAVALTIFLLSLAGMPLTAGFVGKFYIFADTVHMHKVWLGMLLFLTSVVSFFYYFGWIRKIYQADDTPEGAAIRPTGLMNTLLGLCVAGTLVLGIAPGTLLHFLGTAKWIYS
jgi:NADH-quinone oxidoreductase subunit N